jgi:hypothetical protein
MKLRRKAGTVIELLQTPGMFEPTELELGKYIFKVTNRSVDHEVAFLLSEAKKRRHARRGSARLTTT